MGWTVGWTGWRAINLGSSAAFSAAGSAAEQAIVQPAIAPLGEWLGACSGQCDIGIVAWLMPWVVAAAAGCMPSGISSIASTRIIRNARMRWR